MAALGRNNIPASGVAAVVLNITAVEPTGPGYLTTWPTGTTRPTASNINYDAGKATRYERHDHAGEPHADRCHC